MPVLHLSTTARNAAVDGVVSLIDAGAAPGTIKVYGAPMPATPETPLVAQVLLGTLTFSDPAFLAATGGMATADAVTADTSVDADGTATWARVADSDGNTIMDIDVTATGGGGVLTLDTVALLVGGTIAVTGFTLTAPSGV